MDNNQDKIMEAQLKKAIPRAFRQLVKAIKNEPALVIEAEADRPGVSDKTIDEILAWLFKRRGANGY